MNSMNFTYSGSIHSILDTNPAQALQELEAYQGYIHDHADLVQILSRLIGHGYDQSIGLILTKVKVRQADRSVYAKTVADINRILESQYEERFIQNNPELLLDTSFVTTVRHFQNPRDIETISNAIGQLSTFGAFNEQSLILILSDFIIYKRYPTTLLSKLPGKFNLQPLTQNLLRHAHYGHEDFIRRVNVIDIAKQSETHAEGVQFIFDYVQAPPKQLMDYFIAYLQYSKDQQVVSRAFQLLIEKKSIQDVLYVFDALYQTSFVKKSLETILREMYETHRSQYFSNLFNLDLKHNNSMFYDYFVNNYHTIRDRITNDSVDDYKLTLLSLISVKPLFSKLHAKKKVSLINDLEHYSNDDVVMKHVGILLGQIPLQELSEEIMIGLSRIALNSTYAESLISIILKQHWELRRGFIVALLESSSKKFYLKFIKKDIHKLYKNQYIVAELFVDLAEENVHNLNEYMYKKIDKLTKPWSEAMRKERTAIKKAIWKKMNVMDRLWLFVWPF